MTQARRPTFRGAMSVMGALFALACQNVAQDARDQTLLVNEQAALPVAMAQGIGHVQMTGCVGFDFLAPFTVGGQSFSLLVDSGSATLAVAGIACSTCNTKDGFRLSTTSKVTSYLASSRYLDGSEWYGTVIADEVAAGSGNTLATPSDAVSFVRIDKEKEFFQRVNCAKRGDTDFDGIVGLGPDEQLEGNTTSLMTALVSSGRLQRDAFAMQTCDIGGDLWFGGFDASRTLEDPNYTPLIPTGTTANRNNAYAIDILQMSLGGVDFGLSLNSLGPMIVDNGTSNLILTKSAYTALVQILEGNPVYQNNFGTGFIQGTRAQCLAPKGNLTRQQIDQQLPKLAFVFPRTDGGSFTIELSATQSYLVAGVDDGDASATVRYCPAVSAGDSLAIFGNVAMRNHVVIFDRRSQQIGFAKQQGCQSASLYLPDGT